MPLGNALGMGGNPLGRVVGMGGRFVGNPEGNPLGSPGGSPNGVPPLALAPGCAEPLPAGLPGPGCEPVGVAGASGVMLGATAGSVVVAPVGATTVGAGAALWAAAPPPEGWLLLQPPAASRVKITMDRVAIARMYPGRGARGARNVLP